MKILIAIRQNGDVEVAERNITLREARKRVKWVKGTLRRIEEDGMKIAPCKWLFEEWQNNKRIKAIKL